MSFRLPRNLSSRITPDAGVSAFEREVIAEKAASLGRAGKKLGTALAALRDCAAGLPDDALVQAAAEAAYAYFVQRELCGLIDHRGVVEDYEIPRTVIARIGAKRQGLS